MAIIDFTPTRPVSNFRFLARAIAGIRRDLLASYRPEKHYMRGPGPACREKAERERKLAASLASSQFNEGLNRAPEILR